MTIIDQLAPLAHKFRMGLSVEAALELPVLMKSLIPLLPTLPVEAQQQLPQIMSAMLACQERMDWLGLADWMEYELPRLLSASPAAIQEGR